MVQPVVANDRHKFRVHGTRSTGFDRQGPTSGNTAEKLLLSGGRGRQEKGMDAVLGHLAPHIAVVNLASRVDRRNETLAELAMNWPARASRSRTQSATVCRP